MITTRDKTPVQVIGGDFHTGTVEVQREDGSVLKTYVYELKADGGAGEIVRAILKAYEQPAVVTAIR
jgi:hypothetical protein